MSLMKVMFTLVILALVAIGAASGQNVDNCCFVDRECQSDQDWTDGYWAFQNGQCAAPAQSQPLAQAVSQPQPQPQTGGPVAIDNCCFVDRQCQSDQDWTDGYLAFQNGQCAAPAQSQPQAQTVSQPQPQPQPQTGSAIVSNNCCNIDRECHSEADWRAGHTAFADLQCIDAYLSFKPPGSQPILGTNNCCDAPGWLCLSDEHYEKGYRAYRFNNHCPAHVIPTYFPNYVYYDATDNCCDLGRECHTPADWERGYSDFLYFRCEFDLPLADNIPIAIQGPPWFKDIMRAAFSLIKARSPRYYDYATRGLDKIVSRPAGNEPGWRGGFAECWGEKTYVSARSKTQGDYGNALVHEATIIVHEACHCHQYMTGYVAPEPEDVGYELPCYEQQHLAAREIDPGYKYRIAEGYAQTVLNVIDRFPYMVSELENPVSYFHEYIASIP
ncbi:MAG: hypothetical protein OXN94_16215 [Chloroflexota bacterium]|nr:hypothetical protein [Chloroflexota bacterium]